jgi:hypothetical protein
VEDGLGRGNLAKPCERLNSVYFSLTRGLRLPGTAYFSQIPSERPQFDAVVATRLPFGANSTPAATTLQFPSLLMFGISYDVTPTVKISVDGNYTCGRYSTRPSSRSPACPCDSPA